MADPKKFDEARSNNGRNRKSGRKNNKGKGRTSKSRQSRNSSREDKSSDRRDSDPKSYLSGISAEDNDPRWYGVGNPITEGLYNIPQFTPLGSPLNLDDGNNYYYTNRTDVPAWENLSGHRFPGVLTYNWIPSFPKENGAGALNTAYANMYSFVRHANSGKSNYTMGTLACYCIAATSIMAWIANLRRLYGFLTNFDGTNSYYPKTVVEAMGFDYQDLIDHLPQLYAYINYITAKCSAIWLPVTNSLGMRWEMMNSEIYVDSTTLKPQTFFYKMDGIYKWAPESSRPGEAGLYFVSLGDHTNNQYINPAVVNNNTSVATHQFFPEETPDITGYVYWGLCGLEGPTRLLTDYSFRDLVWPIPYMNSDTTVGDIRNYYGYMEKLKLNGIKKFTDWLIDDFINDEDRGIIAGDLLKAYGAGSMYKWPTIPEFYSIAPRFSDEMSMQFRNTRTLEVDGCAGQYIKDDGSSLTINPISGKFQDGTDGCNIAAVLTFDFVAAPKDIAVATRNIPFTDGHGGILSSGSEIVTHYTMWYKTNAFNDIVGANMSAEAYKFWTCFPDTNSIKFWRTMAQIMAFNVKPMLMLYEVGVYNPGGTRVRIVKHLYIDADNYFIYSRHNAASINTAALSFEYGVPLVTGVGK